MGFFKNKRNIFLTIVAGVLLAWSINYTNCGNEKMDSVNMNSGTSENFPSNQNQLVKGASTINDLVYYPSGNMPAPKLTEKQSQMVTELGKATKVDSRAVVVSSAPFLTNGSPNNVVKAITLQSNQKILIGGCFTTYHGSLANRIARLNTDGSLDGTFAMGTGIAGGANVITSDCNGETSVQAFAIQPDGKILVGGNFATYNGTARKSLVRLNTNGTVDNTFTIGTGFSLSFSNAQASVNSIVVLSSGKILVGGVFDGLNGVITSSIVRLNSNGTLDMTFNLGGAGPKLFTQPVQGFGDPVGYVKTIALNPAGEIYVGGQFLKWNGNTLRQLLVKLDANGALISSFSPGYSITSGPIVGVNKVSYSSNLNALLVARDAWSNDTFVALNLQTGGVLSSIMDAVPWPNAGSSNLSDIFGKTIVETPSGKFLGGSSDCIAMFASNGIRTDSTLTLMNSSSTGVDLAYGNVNKAPSYGTTHGTVYALAVQADGKILVGGDFVTHKYPWGPGTTTSAFNLVRINSVDGSLAQ